VRGGKFAEKSVSGGVGVGSFFGGLGVRKFWVAERILHASSSVEKAKNSKGV